MPRKKVEIDYPLVRRIMQTGHSDAELAVLMGVSEGTIANLKGKGTSAGTHRADPKFMRAYNEGKALGRARLRQTIMRMALGAPAEEEIIETTKNGKTITKRVRIRSEQKPNKTMAIWASKNELGWTDKMIVKDESPADAPKKRTIKVRETVNDDNDETEE